MRPITSVRPTRSNEHSRRASEHPNKRANGNSSVLTYGPFYTLDRDGSYRRFGLTECHTRGGQTVCHARWRTLTAPWYHADYVKVPGGMMREA